MVMENSSEVICRFVDMNSAVVRHNLLILQKMKDKRLVGYVFFNFFRIQYGCSSNLFCMWFVKFSNMLNLMSLTLSPCINHCGNGRGFITLELDVAVLVNANTQPLLQCLCFLFIREYKLILECKKCFSCVLYRFQDNRLDYYYYCISFLLSCTSNKII